MKQLDDIIQTYQNIIRETEQKLSKEKRRIYRISTLRFILFYCRNCRSHSFLGKRMAHRNRNSCHHFSSFHLFGKAPQSSVL